MNDPILHFLIVFNHANRHRQIIEFGEDIETAVVRYAEMEDEYRDDRSVEVVLLGSDSIESVRTTHPNYFPEERVDSDWLVGLGLD